MVYDASTADEFGKDYIQLGLAKSVDVLMFQEGAETTQHEVVEIVQPVPPAIANPIPNKKTQDQKEEKNDDVLVIVLLIVLVIVAIVGAMYCIKNRKSQQVEDSEKLIEKPHDRMDSIMSDASVETPMGDKTGI